MTTRYSSVGARLRLLRQELDRTQKEMARLFGTSLRTWQDWESGKTIPGGKLFGVLCDLKVNVNWLFTGQGYAWEGRTDDDALIPAADHHHDDHDHHHHHDGQDHVALEPRWSSVPFIPASPDHLDAALGIAVTLDSAIAKGKTGNLATTLVEEDKAAPELDRGDVVLFDSNVRQIEACGTFVLSDGNRLYVRHVHSADCGDDCTAKRAPANGPNPMFADQLSGLNVAGQVVLKVRPGQR